MCEQRATRVRESMMMMVQCAVAGGSGGVVVSVGRNNWEGPRVAGASGWAGWLQVQVWCWRAWNRVWVSSCAIVFGYDRRGGSEGDRWAG